MDVQSENSSYSKNHDKFFPVIKKKHSKFIEGLFEMIINNMHPTNNFKYWKDLKENYNTEFKLIQKYNKISKYQILEFLEENQFDKVDQFVASFEPTKKQFDFLKDVVLKKEYQIKMQHKEAINHLLEAKNIIERANIDVYSIMRFLDKSVMFKEEQLTKSRSCGGVYKNDYPFWNTWGLESKPQKIKVNLEEDPIFGKASKRHLKNNERMFEIGFNSFSFPN